MKSLTGHRPKNGSPVTETAAISLGRSSVMCHVRDRLERAARSNLRVFLTGEVGTGRAAAAHFFHHAGAPKVGMKLLVLDAPSPSTHVELARWERGSTLYIPELSEVPVAMQVRLHNELSRWRGTEGPPRVVSTSRRPLHELRGEKLVLEELYYFLSECIVNLPPLRRRREDIPTLADAFLEELKMGQRLSSAAHRELEKRPWPGNVCELRAAIRRAGGMHAEQDLLGPELLFDDAPPTCAEGEFDLLLERNWAEAKDEFGRWYWTKLWHRFDGDKRRLVEHSQVSKVWLENRRKLYELCSSH